MRSKSQDIAIKKITSCGIFLLLIISVSINTNKINNIIRGVIASTKFTILLNQLSLLEFSSILFSELKFFGISPDHTKSPYLPVK